MTLNKTLTALGTAFAALALSVLPALAQDTPWVPNTGNTAWMLTSTALVLMMTIPGLALFYGGMVRKKNVLATVMQSFAITCLITVIWFVLGYSIAFGTADGGLNAYIGGFSKVFHNGVTVASPWLPGVADIPEFVFSMFQLTFAIITPALIAGAFAERM
jgi:Amt family ammonium transporter